MYEIGDCVLIRFHGRLVSVIIVDLNEDTLEYKVKLNNNEVLTIKEKDIIYEL